MEYISSTKRRREEDSLITYDKNCKLGSGTHAHVYRGTFEKKQVAVKIMTFEDTDEPTPLREELALKLLRNNPNVVYLFHKEETMTSTGFVCWKFALELCDGTLNQFYDPNHHLFQFKTILTVNDALLQLAKGLHAIHQQCVFHRDIKPANVLVLMKGSKIVLKWADFGFSKKFNPENSTMSLTDQIGTMGWMAPEMINSPEEDSNHLRGTVKSDVFSEGLLFGYIALEGDHPFGEIKVWNFLALLNNISKEPPNFDALKTTMHQDKIPLFEKMLDKNHKNRPTSVEVLSELEELFRITVAFHGERIRFDETKLLGRGSFGTVYQGFLNGAPVAVKKVIPMGFLDSCPRWGRLRHENVIQLLDFEDNGGFRYYAMPLCQATLDHIFEGNHECPMPSIIQTMLQIAKAVEYIHSLSMIHRGIKPANFLVHVNEGQSATIKLCDFDLLLQVDGNGFGTDCGIKGTLAWMAPELLDLASSIGHWNESDPITIPVNGIKCDVFSTGLVFAFLLLYGRHPYGGPFYRKTYLENNNPFKLQDLPKHYEIFRDIVVKMVPFDPSERLTSTQVVRKLEEMEKVLQNELSSLCNAENPNEAHLNILIKCGVDLNKTDENGMTPLLALCRYAKTNLLRCLEILFDNRPVSSGVAPVDVKCKSPGGEDAIQLLCGNASNHMKDLRKIMDILRTN